MDTVRMLATLRRFLREGTPWRSLRASEDEASGSTLRRAFQHWARTGLLRKVHALLSKRHAYSWLQDVWPMNWANRA